MRYTELTYIVNILKLIQGESTFIFSGGGKKCRKDHEVKESILLRAASLCKVKIQVYTPYLFILRTFRIWYYILLFHNHSGCVCVCMYACACVCVYLHACLKKFTNRTFKMITIIYVYYIYIALIAYLALKMFTQHVKAVLEQR